MTIHQLEQRCKALRIAEDNVGTARQLLCDDMVTYFAEYEGSFREAARKVGVSAMFLWDVAHGWRAPNEAFIAKLVKL